LRLHGVDAKDHPINTELTRLKQYFAKIEDLEKGPEKRTMTLDQGAARRFISRGLVSDLILICNEYWLISFNRLAMINLTLRALRNKPKKKRVHSSKQH
jgi:hypothetical protein